MADAGSGGCCSKGDASAGRGLANAIDFIAGGAQEARGFLAVESSGYRALAAANLRVQSVTGLYRTARIKERQSKPLAVRLNAREESAMCTAWQLALGPASLR